MYHKSYPKVCPSNELDGYVIILYESFENYALHGHDEKRLT